MNDEKKCAVCNGKGKIELLDSSCPFCNGTGEFTKFQKAISSLTYVNVFSLTEKFVRYVEKDVTMTHRINQKYYCIQWSFV